MQIKQSELKKLGIDLPMGRYTTKTSSNRIDIYKCGGDTEGCILVGMHRTDTGVADSRAAFNLLLPEIQEALAMKQEVRCLIN